MKTNYYNFILAFLLLQVSSSALLANDCNPKRSYKADFIAILNGSYTAQVSSEGLLGETMDSITGESLDSLDTDPSDGGNGNGGEGDGGESSDSLETINGESLDSLDTNPSGGGEGNGNGNGNGGDGDGGESSDSLDTVNGESLDSLDTVSAESLDSLDTISEESLDSLDTNNGGFGNTNDSLNTNNGNWGDIDPATIAELFAYIQSNYPDSYITSSTVEADSTTTYYIATLDNSVQITFNEEGAVITLTGISGESAEDLLPESIQEAIEDLYPNQEVTEVTTSTDADGNTVVIVTITIGGGKNAELVKLTFDLYGNLISEELVGASGIADLTQFISIYPNPNNGVLNIQSNNLEILSITVMDLSGRIIAAQTAENAYSISQDLRGKFNGLAIVQVETVQGTAKFKVQVGK